MTWSRATRRPDRGRCRPGLEAMEVRTLLSEASHPIPSPAQSPSTSPPIDPTDAITGASAARAQYGVDGAGLAVAVIDTGVDYNNPALGGGFGPGRKVVAGADLADGDGDPMATWQHGTAVAGIVASSDPAHPGVAPGADVVALRVFGNDNSGSFDRIADALQWVIDHHDEDRITAVNLSISDGANYNADWYSNDGGIGQRINGLIGQLKALDIPVVAAAGNSFDGNQGMGFTAILKDTISVTATDGSDHLAADAQRLGTALGGANATDLAAPGVNVTAPQGDRGFLNVSGTSFAAPEVTGAIVLLQQLYARRFGHLPSVDDLTGWLKQGADPIQDPVTGITLGRLNIAKAAALVPGAPAIAPQDVPAPPSTPATPETPAAPAPTPAPAPSPETPAAPATPAPPVATPAPAPAPEIVVQVPASDPPAGGSVRVVVNGQGSDDVPITGPLQSFLSALGPGATLDRVQVWTGGNAASNGSDTPGSLQAASSSANASNTVTIPQRRQALRLARQQKRAALFAARAVGRAFHRG